MRMRIIIAQGKILVFKIKNTLHVRINFHPGQSTRFTGQLQFHLFNMIQVNMRIPQRMYKFPWFQPAYLSDHHCQQGIRGNIERYSQECISTTLVKLARQFPVSYIKLEQRMTRRAKPYSQYPGIPCAHDQPTGIRVMFNIMHHLGNLSRKVPSGLGHERH